MIFDIHFRLSIFIFTFTFALHQLVSVCISLYQSVSAYISLCELVISLYQLISVCISLYQSVSVCISLYQSVSADMSSYFDIRYKANTKSHFCAKFHASQDVYFQRKLCPICSLFEHKIILLYLDYEITQSFFDFINGTCSREGSLLLICLSRSSSSYTLEDSVVHLICLSTDCE